MTWPNNLSARLRMARRRYASRMVRTAGSDPNQSEGAGRLLVARLTMTTLPLASLAVRADLLIIQ